MDSNASFHFMNWSRISKGSPNSVKNAWMGKTPPTSAMNSHSPLAAIGSMMSMACLRSSSRSGLIAQGLNSGNKMRR